MFLTDEPTSILDAYGLTKILFKFFGIKNIATIVNNVIDFDDGREVLNIFDQATLNFLGVKFENFAIVPYEKDLKKYLFNLNDFIRNTDSKEFLYSINEIVEKIVQLKLNENILV
jgi:MinD-like ATPase involved in chromosome partitioning or flagellar assembly